jgi:hypothetical protein
LATTADLIDEIITVHEGFDDPDAANLIALRAKLVKIAQRSLSYIWNLRNWTFRETESTVSCTAGQGYLPDDFLRFGPHGGCFKTSTCTYLTWVSLKRMEELRLLEASTSTAEYYTVGGTVGLDDDDNVGKRILYIYPLQASVTVNIAYERMVPTIIDAGDGLEPPTDGLVVLPSPFYYPLYELIVYHRMVEKGNATQSQEQKAIYSEALADLIKIEQQGVEASHRIVPYSGRSL